LLNCDTANLVQRLYTAFNWPLPDVYSVRWHGTWDSLAMTFQGWVAFDARFGGCWVRDSLQLYLGNPLVSGCTDPAACNFSADANSDDGSCIEAGCTDPAACNFDPEAGCDDGSCAPAEAVPGCMEAAACNYDAAAVCAGPCVYPPAGSADCGAGAAVCGEGRVWDAAQQTCLIDPAYVAGIAAGAAQGRAAGSRRSGNPRWRRRRASTRSRAASLGRARRAAPAACRARARRGRGRRAAGRRTCPACGPT
jgi:hypothetical protein